MNEPTKWGGTRCGGVPVDPSAGTSAGEGVGVQTLAPSLPRNPECVSDAWAEDLFSLYQIAETLPGKKRNIATIRGWIQRGIKTKTRQGRVFLKGTKIDGQWFVSATDLSEFLWDTDRGKWNNRAQEIYRVVRHALVSGRLLRSNSCDVCGRSDLPIHLHHEDYGRPLWLASLCAGCHLTLHHGPPNQRDLITRTLAGSQEG